MKNRIDYANKIFAVQTFQMRSNMEIKGKGNPFNIHSKALGSNDFYKQKTEDKDKYELKVKISKVALNLSPEPEPGDSNIVGCRISDGCAQTAGNCSYNCCASVCSSC